MDTTIKQLKFAALFVIGSGLFILLGSHGATAFGVELWADILFWPAGDADDLTKEAELLSAILGGAMVGWGITLWGLASLLPVAPVRVRKVILTSAVAWVVLDSVGSIAAGAPLNVVLNIGYLLLFVVPLRTAP